MLKQQLTSSIEEIDQRIAELDKLANDYENLKQERIKLTGRKEMAIFTLNTIEANESANTDQQAASDTDGEKATDSGEWADRT